MTFHNNPGAAQTELLDSPLTGIVLDMGALVDGLLTVYHSSAGPSCEVTVYDVPPHRSAGTQQPRRQAVWSRSQFSIGTSRSGPNAGEEADLPAGCHRIHALKRYLEVRECQTIEAMPTRSHRPGRQFGFCRYLLI